MIKDPLKKLIKPPGFKENSDEIETRRWGIIHLFKPASDVFVLKYGASILSSLVAISGMSFHIHYRKFLKLGRIGFISGALPSILLPSAMTGLMQYHFVLTPLVTIQSAMCPTCFEIRSACIQVVGGVLAPILTTSSVALFTATIGRSTAMPRWQDFSYWLKFYKDLNKGIPRKAAYFSVMHMAASLVFVSFAVKSLAKVWDYEHGSRKLLQKKYRVEAPNEEQKPLYPLLSQTQEPVSGQNRF
ncbi:hypothetical protein RvY_16078 [Ramazzottius varieornatus]|uniref:Uncharacterized protein n=1 Tax=Ramazzottius varieornatus TaxID=947166 RepID=A0A1D1W4Z6_RAMVA|nr:hypothetical protein RvY_16078 [Ramazzottius varieornatus]